MGKDTTAFRERFNAYKNGKSVSEIYDAGLPRYGGGKNGKKSRFNKSVGGKYQHVIDDTIDYLHSQGVDPIRIAGILGNMAQESGFDPDSIGPGGFAGTVQMSSDMAKEIKRAYGKVDYQTTNRFIHDSMSGNKIISLPWRNYMKLHGGYYGRTFDSAGDAAMAFGRVFERPNEKYANWEQRMLSAEDALDYVNKRIGTPIEEVPISQTTAAEYNAAHQSQPWLNYHQPDYPLNNPAPSSISSWNNPKSPAYTPAGLQARRIDFGKMMMDMLEDDWEPPVIQPLKTVAPPDSKISIFTEFKNGKLPRYGGGTPTKVGEYNVYPSAVGASELNVTVPEVTVTGIDRRPMYQRYDAENSTYDPDAIRTFTDWAPVVSDIGDGLDAYNAFKNKDWSLFGIIAGAALLPNVIEKALRPVLRFVLPIAKRYISPLVDKYISPTMDRLFSNTKQLSLPSSETSLHIIDNDFNFDVSPNLEDSRATAVRNATAQSILDAFDSRLPYAKNTTDPLVRAVPATMENNKKLVDHYLLQIKEKYPGVSDEEAKELFGQIYEASVDDVLYARGMTVRDPVTHEVKFVSYNNQGNKTRSAATKTHEENHTMYDLSPDRFLHPTVTALDSPLGVKKNYLNEEAGYSLPKNISDPNNYDGVEEYLSADEVSSFMSEAKSLLGKTEDEKLTLGDIEWFIKNHNQIGIKLLLSEVYKSIAEHITNAKKFALWCNDYSNVVAALAIGGAASTAAALLGYANGKLPGYKNGKIHIKPANRGKFTALKKRTGHSASWFKENGTPEQKKMAVFALNAKKWKH